MSTTFDDTLEDLGGYTLFDPVKTKLNQAYPFLKQIDKDNWNKMGRAYYGFDVADTKVYVRFVDPRSPRFGSIAHLAYRPYFTIPSYSGMSAKHSQDHINQTMSSWNYSRTYYGEVKWKGRSNNPSVSTYYDLMEYLPDYDGPTVWAYDKERGKRVDFTKPLDKLGREIEVGQFCCYILYQFDGKGAANIYFGNVTKVDQAGDVYCTNVKLSSSDKSQETKVKYPHLVTILTDDLMKQLMIARLASI